MAGCMPACKDARTGPGGTRPAPQPGRMCRISSATLKNLEKKMEKMGSDTIFGTEKKKMGSDTLFRPIKVQCARYRGKKLSFKNLAP